MSTASSDNPSEERAPGPRPLSRKATRIFVIASILFVIAATIGSTYYLVRMTSQALDAPVDTSRTDTIHVDTTQTGSANQP